ncbi:hypothetical protein PoB_002313200 [Plakobranchus ocellatus]|uniref:Reverse transcriptase domain-containing protein n=1 Tax=Plakobranchus ocellatus TaxID=259542 RepID=A0AAV3ZPN3_9GAST|nr:hypothetical protein PoB_002313200 [Plakobranchus ocellatus]
METFLWKRRTSSTGGQNTSQRCITMKIKAPIFLRRKFKRPSKKMKKGKVAGPDDIPFALGEFGIKEVIKLLNTIHATGKIPTDFKKSMYIALPKKPGTVECDQHRK